MPPADIEPVARESTAALLARRLRSAITTGSLPPGTQLGETDLATRFRVSRGPLREAMQRLVAEGLLHGERHRGLFVIDPTPADIHDIHTARAAVERAALQTVLNSARESTAETLTESVDTMADAAHAGDSVTLTEAELRFHEMLVTAAGSTRLNRTAATLMAELRTCLAARPGECGFAHERVTEHRDIVAAIRDGTTDTALRLLDTHMANVVRRLTRNVRDVPAGTVSA